MVRKSTEENLFQVITVLLLVMLCLITLYPFWYQVMLSLSNATQARSGGAFLIPRGFSLEAYKTVLNSNIISIGYANSIFVTLIGTSASLAVTAAMAYPLSKKELPGNKLFTILVVFTMLFSGGLIPTYLVVKATGLLDSLWSIIIPSLVSPFNLIIIRNFFSGVPREIEESAKIDGADEFKVFIRIILPLSMPVLATVGLWLAVGYWNGYFSGLVYLNSRGKFLLQMLLMEIINSTKAEDVFNVENPAAITPETVKAASIMVSTIPILFIYPFLQKYFVKGVMLGSVKG